MYRRTEVKTYAVPGVLSWELHRPRRRDHLPDVNLPYKAMAWSTVQSQDALIEIGPFEPDLHDCFLVDHHYYVRHNYIFAEERRGQSRWRMELTGLESDPIRVRFHGELDRLMRILAPDLLAQTVVLEPMLRLQLFRRDVAAVHAAGLRIGNRGVVLAGGAGTFKTSATMDLVRTYDADILSDDWVLLGPDGMRGFPKHIEQLAGAIQHLRDERIVTVADRLRWLMAVRSRGDSEFRWLRETQPIDMVLVLRRSNQTRLSTTAIDPREAAAMITANVKVEAIRSMVMRDVAYGVFNDCLLAYSYLFPRSRPATFWQDLESLIESRIVGASVLAVDMPRVYTRQVAEDLMALIDHVGGA